MHAVKIMCHILSMNLCFCHYTLQKVCPTKTFYFKGNHDGNSIGYYQKKHIKVLQRETFCREKLFFRPIFSVFSRFLSHENIRRFLMFSGELKENIGKKWAELQMFKYTLVIKEEPQIWKFAA